MSLKQIWSCTPLVPSLGRQRQVNLGSEFRISLIYRVSSRTTQRNCILKNQKKRKKNVTSFLHLVIKRYCPHPIGEETLPAGVSRRVDVIPNSTLNFPQCRVVFCFLLLGSSFIYVGPGSEDSHQNLSPEHTGLGLHTVLAFSVILIW